MDEVMVRFHGLWKTLHVKLGPPEQEGIKKYADGISGGQGICFARAECGFSRFY